MDEQYPSGPLDTTLHSQLSVIATTAITIRLLKIYLQVNMFQTIPTHGAVGVTTYKES